MEFKLNTNSEYIKVPEGEQVLTITRAEAKPAGKPQFIEIDYKGTNGGVVKSNYSLTDEKGVAIFSILVDKVLGARESFNTDDLGQLLGKSVVAEIVHKVVPSTKDPSKTVTFVNIAKLLRAYTPASIPTSINDDDLA